MTQPSAQITRELDGRTADGVEVRLLWCQSDGRLTVRRRTRVLDLSRHPYAYATRPQSRTVPIAVSHSS